MKHKTTQGKGQLLMEISNEQQKIINLTSEVLVLRSTVSKLKAYNQSLINNPSEISKPPIDISPSKSYILLINKISTELDINEKTPSEIINKIQKLKNLNTILFKELDYLYNLTKEKCFDIDSVADREIKKLLKLKQ